MLDGKHLTSIIVTSLVCVTALEIVALCQGVDGIVFASVITIFGVFIGSAGTSIFMRKR